MAELAARIPARRLTAAEAARFWSKVDRNGPVPDHAPHLGPCWVWTAAKTQGYGVFRREGDKLERAGRVAWMNEHGDIPERTIDHLCANRACVRPSHLEPVPYGENTRRGWVNRKPETCKRGHPLDDAYITPSGSRDCRICSRERKRAYKQRMRGAR